MLSDSSQSILEVLLKHIPHETTVEKDSVTRRRAPERGPTSLCTSSIPLARPIP